MHAVTHEISLLALTILAASGHGAGEILVLNIGLTMFYVGYTAAFHAVWDRMRPVAGVTDRLACPA